MNADKTVYRIIEHKTNKITGGLEVGEEIDGENREIRPVRLVPAPYNFESGTVFANKILVWFDGDWWLTDNPEQEFGRPDYYVDLGELPVVSL